MEMDPLLEELFGVSTEVQSSQMAIDVGRVFNTKDGYILIDSKGKEVKGIRWEKQPETLSYVFLKHSGRSRDKLYTIIGEEVQGLDCDRILCVLNFWVWYTRNGKQYLGHLDPDRMKFVCKSEIEIEDCGLLAVKGCVVKIGGEWRIYKYLFHLIEDTDKAEYDIRVDKLNSFLSEGFTASYLNYLCIRRGIACKIETVDQYKAWNAANMDAISILKKVSGFTDEYSIDQISRVLGLNKHLISVLRYYIHLKDVQMLC